MTIHNVMGGNILQVRHTGLHKRRKSNLGVVELLQPRDRRQSHLLNKRRRRIIGQYFRHSRQTNSISKVDGKILNGVVVLINRGLLVFKSNPNPRQVLEYVALLEQQVAADSGNDIPRRLDLALADE